MRREAGATTVEFALVAPVTFLVLFGCIEVARALFIWNTVVEATRYGARVAVITDPTTPDVVRTALVSHATPLNFTNSSSQITVTYYQSDGTTTTTSLNNAAFATVSVSGLTHSLLIPFVGQNITIPAFSTTLPTESLGFDPDT